ERLADPDTGGSGGGGRRLRRVVLVVIGAPERAGDGVGNPLLHRLGRRRRRGGLGHDRRQRRLDLRRRRVDGGRLPGVLGDHVAALLLAAALLAAFVQRLDAAPRR